MYLLEKRTVLGCFRTFITNYSMIKINSVNFQNYNKTKVKNQKKYFIKIINKNSNNNFDNKFDKNLDTNTNDKNTFDKIYDYKICIFVYLYTYTILENLPIICFKNLIIILIKILISFDKKLIKVLAKILTVVLKFLLKFLMF